MFPIGSMPIRGEQLVDVCFDMRVWTPDDVSANAAAEAAATDTRAETSAESAPAEPPPLPFINIAAWDGVTAPEREWVVPRSSLKNVTLLSGEGGGETC